MQSILEYTADIHLICCCTEVPIRDLLLLVLSLHRLSTRSSRLLFTPNLISPPSNAQGPALDLHQGWWPDRQNDVISRAHTLAAVGRNEIEMIEIAELGGNIFSAFKDLIWLDIYNAISEAREEKTKPTIIRLRTTIGYGSTQQGTHGVHDPPLKADDIQALKTKLGFPPNEAFYIPEETYEVYGATATRGAKLEKEWDALLASYGQKYPKERAELTRPDAAQAFRKLSELVLTAITPVLPDLMGGSTDLTGSNLTRVKAAVDFQPPSTGLGNYAGTYVCYDVNDVGYQNSVSYTAGAVRLSALSKHQVIWVATHDSIGLGDEMPGLMYMRQKNIFSTQDHAPAALAATGVPLFAWKLGCNVINAQDTPYFLQELRITVPNLTLSAAASIVRFAGPDGSV
ncbi:hypothetical protein PHLCEN_2v13347 [Hermanssonia centrifuga]|uniref:Transketolase N-terminal domain-containing protein n=1 Tax=Hermanssonia centrifuga TaxID=98765 RepID=A0A2R6NEJ3_9APHY|nr:hypothetical protein PHLCEN_2v13347 [Hermanssonia centrifuga]